MTVEGKTVFEQGKGLLVLVGVADGDTERDADVLSAKIVKMRIFGDENEKMNRSVTDIGGDIAVVPNLRFSHHAGEETAPILRIARLPRRPSGCLNISRRSRRMRSEK